MSGKKQNFRVGKVEGLTEAQQKMLKYLLNISHYGQANWQAKKNLNLSMDTICRAKKELHDRGILLNKRGYVALNPKILVKLKEED